VGPPGPNLSKGLQLICDATGVRACVVATRLVLEESRHVVDDGSDDDDDDVDARSSQQRRCAELLDGATDGVVAVDRDEHRQPDSDRVQDHRRRPDVDDVVERRPVYGRQVPGVRVDGRQRVHGDGDEQQQRVTDGHALQQEDGRPASGAVAAPWWHCGGAVVALVADGGRRTADAAAPDLC